MITCPSCQHKMIKQKDAIPMDGELEVRNCYKHHELWEAEYFDSIVEWWKCSNSKCPMTIYLSNEAKKG